MGSGQKLHLQSKVQRLAGTVRGAAVRSHRQIQHVLTPGFRVQLMVSYQSMALHLFRGIFDTGKLR